MVMIGKGLRSKEVIESVKKNCAVYFAAIVGVTAVITKSIKSSEVVAYKDLGPKVFIVLCPRFSYDNIY